MIHIAHQTLSDLRRVSMDFAGQIMGNCNLRFVFRQDDPDDAETWSRFFGTREETKETWSLENGSKTGMGSMRDTRVFKIGPDEIKNLATGRCIFSSKTPNILTNITIPFRKERKGQTTLKASESLQGLFRPSRADEFGREGVSRIREIET